MGTRNLLQALVFLILTRILGIAGYGMFAAVLALATTLASFVGFGTQVLVIQDVARAANSFAASWGRLLGALAISIPLAFFCYLGFAWLALPETIPFLVVVLIGLADVVFAPLTSAAMRAYQGHERIGDASRMVLVPVILRLASALFVLVWSSVVAQHQILLLWVSCYTLASLIAAGYCLVMVQRDLGTPIRPSWVAIRASIREGIAFSFAGAAMRLYSDIDKTMLARMSTLNATGAYSAAYRIADMATLPYAAFVSAALPRFFRVGGSGLGNTISYARKLLPAPFTYALITSVGLYFLADTLPAVLGSEYHETVITLRWLAWLPLASLLRIFLQTAMSTSGYQNSIVIVTILGALANICLNLSFIPSWGWRGAVIATYLAEALIFSLMVAIVTLERWRNRKCNQQLSH